MIRVAPVGYKAKMFIPCIHGRCPSRMQLLVVDKRGEALERAYYKCERKDCIGHTEPTYPENIRHSYWVVPADTKRTYKSNDSLTREEMEVMI